MEVIANELNKLKDDLDSMQTQIYIISGVAGGLCLILIFGILMLAVKMARIKRYMNTLARGTVGPDDLSKRGFSAYTGNSAVSQATTVSPSPTPQPTFSPPAISPMVPRGFSYENNGYSDQQPQQRRIPNPTDHGVQVLPKNPPPPRATPPTDAFY